MANKKARQVLDRGEWKTALSLQMRQSLKDDLQKIADREYRELGNLETADGVVLPAINSCGLHGEIAEMQGSLLASEVETTVKYPMRVLKRGSKNG